MLIIMIMCTNILHMMVISSDVELETTSDGSATEAVADVDYPSFTRTSVTFTADDTSETIPIPITNDNWVEVTESFQITLRLPQNPCGADVSAVVDDPNRSARLDIIDDDSKLIQF